MLAWVFATLLLGGLLTTMAPGDAVADPLGDAVASGWIQRMADNYRGFVPPGVSPTGSWLNSDESTWRDTPCLTGDAAAKTDAARPAALKSGDLEATCGDADRKSAAGR
jgi:hypothetical protein